MKGDELSILLALEKKYLAREETLKTLSIPAGRTNMLNVAG